MGKGQRGDQYEAAMNAYNRLNNLYGDYAKQYTGNAGYNNAIQQAAGGAGVVAQNQAAQQQNAIRNATGMTRAQAAAMGANAINNNYQNAFANQQNMATNQQQNLLNATNQQAQNNMSAAQTEQAENQNRYDRTWGNIGNVANIAGSVGTPFKETFASAGN